MPTTVTQKGEETKGKKNRAFQLYKRTSLSIAHPRSTFILHYIPQELGPKDEVYQQNNYRR